MKNILLVKPSSRYFYTVTPNLGLGYLASALLRDGHRVEILDCDKEGVDADRLRGRLADRTFDMIGFQVYTHNLDSVRDGLKTARSAAKGAVLVIGGPHPSGDPRQALQYLEDADLAVIGEGEEAIAKLAGITGEIRSGKADLGGINNIAYRDKDGTVIANPIKYVEDLDRISRPAWDLIDPRTYPDAPHGTFARAFPVAPIITTRGCPYPCSFCASFRIHGRKIRKRSPAGVVDEITFLTEHFKVGEIHIEDDNFTMSRDYASEVMEGIIDRGLDVWIALPNGVRLDSLDVGLVRLMERAGCYSFGIGIESGSDRILKKLHKSLSTKMIEEKVALIKKNSGIRMTGFFLMGHPDETEEDILKSIEFALKLKLDRVSFSPLMPLPGSEIYDTWIKSMAGKGIDWGDFLHYRFVPFLSPLDIEKLKILMKKANARFYLRPHIISGLLSEIKTPYQFSMAAKRAVKILFQN